MFEKDYRDIIGGGLMILLGASVVLYGMATLPLGTPQRMGPGFFPVGVGGILTLLGAGIFVPALFRPGTLDAMEWRPLVAITLSLIAFGLVVPMFGLIPAITALVAISTLAQEKIRLLSIAAIAASLSLLSYLIFNLGLGLTLPMVRWPY